MITLRSCDVIVLRGYALLENRYFAQARMNSDALAMNLVHKGGS